jgi:hypothetical protein
MKNQIGTNYDPIINDYKNSPYNNYNPYSSKPSPIDWNNQVQPELYVTGFYFSNNPNGHSGFYDTDKDCKLNFL